VILSDQDIVKRIRSKSLIVSPFTKTNLQPSTLDLRLDPNVLVFDNYSIAVIDVAKPINVSRKVKVGSDGFIIHPGEFILGSTIEHFSIPTDLAAKVEGRSSLGRLGLVIHATAGYIDPGFSGNITFEISNISRLPIKLYAKMRIAQIAFHQMTSSAAVPYGDKKLGSKYKGQRGPTESRLYKDFKK
jgi:dCTP deaminase